MTIKGMPARIITIFTVLFLVLSACGGNPTEEQATNQQFEDPEVVVTEEPVPTQTELPPTDPPPTDPPPTEIPPTDTLAQEDSTLSPCDLNNQLLGQVVIVSGQVGFVGLEADGMFFELNDQGCTVGIFIEMATWEAFPQDVKAIAKTGNQITVQGELGLFEGELEIELFTPAVTEPEG